MALTLKEKGSEGSDEKGRWKLVGRDILWRWMNHRVVVAEGFWLERKVGTRVQIIPPQTASPSPLSRRRVAMGPYCCP